MGLASRAQAREWILSGTVKVGGRICRDPEFLVERDNRIEHGGNSLQKEEARVLLFHKPRGVVTTRRDEKDRPTIYSLLGQEDQRLHAVGRLDMATSGLLILTNNTRLSDWLADPKNQIPRTYVATVRGRLSGKDMDRLLSGIVDRGESLVADKVVLRKASGRESHLTVVLSEGKNREIRRMFAALGHEVTRLKRVAFGTLELGQVQPGESRELSLEEIRRNFPRAPI